MCRLEFFIQTQIDFCLGLGPDPDLNPNPNPKPKFFLGKTSAQKKIFVLCFELSRDVQLHLINHDYNYIIMVM